MINIYPSIYLYVYIYIYVYIFIYIYIYIYIYICVCMSKYQCTIAIDISNKTRVMTRTSGVKQLLPPGILNVHCQVAKILQFLFTYSTAGQTP